MIFPRGVKCLALQMVIDFMISLISFSIIMSAFSLNLLISYRITRHSKFSVQSKYISLQKVVLLSPPSPPPPPPPPPPISNFEDYIFPLNQRLTETL